MNLFEHLHPAIVHFPIALLVIASAGGLLALYRPAWRDLRVGVWAAMVLGWISCAAAVLSGLVAQSSLPPQAEYRGVLNLHIGAGLAILLVYGALLYWGWLARPRAQTPKARAGRTSPVDPLLDPRRRWLTAALLILGAALVFLTGLNGGELVFTWGVNVGN